MQRVTETLRTTTRNDRLDLKGPNEANFNSIISGRESRTIMVLSTQSSRLFQFLQARDLDELHRITVMRVLVRSQARIIRRAHHTDTITETFQTNTALVTTVKARLELLGEGGDIRL